MSNNIPSDVYKFIKYSLYTGVLFGFSVLLVSSFLVFDTNYIVKHPKFFTSETLITGILTAIPMAYLSYIRGSSKSEIINGSGLMFLKIILIHIGFQLSGVYSVIFPESA
jgi:hypothetical protein